MDELIISIFCELDNFCKEFFTYVEQSSLPCDKKKLRLEPSRSLSLSEIMTICVGFHLSGYRNFKWYYTRLIVKQYRKFFPKLVSYNRFIELMPHIAIPLTLFLQKNKTGTCTGITFMDSTILDVCDSHRIPQHKVFQGIAQRGKSSTGWFYGFKLHLTINECGEILNFCVTPGNVDDRILLRKRAIIESVNDFLKNVCQIEHSRHRRGCNFITNLVSGLVAYSFLPKKPSIQFGIISE